MRLALFLLLSSSDLPSLLDFLLASLSLSLSTIVSVLSSFEDLGAASFPSFPLLLPLLPPSFLALTCRYVQSRMNNLLTLPHTSSLSNPSPSPPSSSAAFEAKRRAYFTRTLVLAAISTLVTWIVAAAMLAMKELSVPLNFFGPDDGVFTADSYKSACSFFPVSSTSLTHSNLSQRHHNRLLQPQRHSRRRRYRSRRPSPYPPPHRSRARPLPRRVRRSRLLARSDRSLALELDVLCIVFGVHCALLMRRRWRRLGRVLDTRTSRMSFLPLTPLSLSSPSPYTVSPVLFHLHLLSSTNPFFPFLSDP